MVGRKMDFLLKFGKKDKLGRFLGILKWASVGKAPNHKITSLLR